MKNFTLLSLLIPAIVACSQGSSSSGQLGAGAALVAGSNQAIIENEDLSAGLKGVDANNNGIRDDIDRLIEEKYSATPEMKRAVQQSARALQAFMEATNKAEARAAAQQVGRAVDCRFKVFPHSTAEDDEFRLQASKEVEALTANTKERFAKYWDSNRLIGGMIFSEAPEPVCD